MVFGFFKNKKRELTNLVNQALSDGILTDEEYEDIIEKAKEYKIDKALIDKLRVNNFNKRIEPIRNEIEKNCLMSPEQENEINKIAKDLQVSSNFDPTFMKYRALWEYENLGNLKLTALDLSDIILNQGEEAFTYLAGNWQQLKKKRVSHGFAGAGLSFRVAKGVRFSVGRAFPIGEEYEEMSDISSGILIITNKRILFNGSKRTTSITRGRLISVNVFEDGIEIRKSSGQPDFFQLDKVDSFYASAVINEVLVNPK